MKEALLILIRPFLKWPGGKFRLVERIKEQLPTGRRLIEPFLGSGSLFLNTDEYDTYLLSDINPDLINLYKQLQAGGEEFIAYCKSFFTAVNNTSDTYYIFRDKFNSTGNPRLKAALFLYLNRFGYNGLVRYNQNGHFNAAFGSYAQPYFPEAELHHFYKKAQRAEFMCCDFEKTMLQAKPGDVVYADPPYVAISPTANFTSYSAGGFGRDEQLRLVAIAKKLVSQGIPVLISNHDVEFARNLYSSAKIISFEVQRSVSCIGSKRGKAQELLAVFC